MGSKSRSLQLDEKLKTISIPNVKSDRMSIKQRDFCYSTSAKSLNVGEKDAMEIIGFKRSSRRTILIWLLILLTVGILRLVFYWWPRLFLSATHKKCAIFEADKILAIEQYHKQRRYYVKKVQTISVDAIKTSIIHGSRGTSYELTSSKVTSNRYRRRLRDHLLLHGSPRLIISHADGSLKEECSIRFFSCKKLRYVWNDQEANFVRLTGLENVNTKNVYQSVGLTMIQQWQRLLVFGSNETPIKILSVVKLLYAEILSPLYIFQMFAISIWLGYEYYYFAAVVILMTIWGVGSSIIGTRKSQLILKSKMQSSDTILVYRGTTFDEAKRGLGTIEAIPTEHLVPGDLIVIPSEGCHMHCDAVLLNGTCIVNESSLTGESIPEIKIPLPEHKDLFYNKKLHERSTIFAGTYVMQTRSRYNEKGVGLVIRTGFQTAKGNLIRAILYPPPVTYEFEQDSYKFIGVLAGIASIGVVYTLYLKINDGDSLGNIILASLDLVTIAVPPTLPAAMSMCLVHAVRRLAKKSIYCINPRAINAAGSLNCVCFDKTGTLTENGLDLLEILPNVDKESHLMKNVRSSEFTEPILLAEKLDVGPLKIGLACCNTLMKVNGKIVGDPLDMKMFEWTEWDFEQPTDVENQVRGVSILSILRPQSGPNSLSSEIGQNRLEIDVIRQFPFSFELERMSVIVTRGSLFELYAKGSPEMIASLSRPETIPENFATVLNRRTTQGYRVIALASRNLENLDIETAHYVPREQVEKDLSFLGFVILENRPKKESKGAVGDMRIASIRILMVTGDNILTAIKVAEDCGIVDADEKIVIVRTVSDKDNDGLPKLYYNCRVVEKDSFKVENRVPIMDSARTSDVELPNNQYRLAITGDAFTMVKKNFPKIFQRFLVRGVVFARMKPNQKQELVEHLQTIGYNVGMCGDGANDAAALRVADTGISLSEEEASAASAFTSKISNISCFPNLIQEGRSTLTSSFAIFKYMALYSLIQFTTAIILYGVDGHLSDLQYLYIDLCLMSTTVLLIGRTQPNPGQLAKRPPSSSLVSIQPITSIVCQTLLVIAFQLLTFFFVHTQPWYQLHDKKAAYHKDYTNHEDYSLLTVSIFQYISLVVVYSKGKPHRQPIYRNYLLFGVIVLVTGISLWLVIWPPPFIQHLNSFEIIPPPSKYLGFRFILLAFAVAHFAFALLLEYLVVDFLLLRKTNWCGWKSQKAYEKIEKDILNTVDWPPLSGK